MKKEFLRSLIDVASGRKKAEFVLKNGNVIDVYNGTIIKKDVAIYGNRIAGVGEYSGEKEIDLNGMYISPGLIDSHIHVESTHLTPEEFAALLVPFGTTSVISDPHEIVNVCGMDGFRYMKDAAKNSALNTYFMVPSCVPATPMDDSGGTVLSKDMVPDILEKDVPGLGEMMDFYGVVAADNDILDKIILAKDNEKIIDGHACGLLGNDIQAYAAAGILTDHECTSLDEMNSRISAGMYVLLRMGTACHDLKVLMEGLNESNYRRCLLCSDDREPDTVYKEGHLQQHLKMITKSGKLDAIKAITMASLNAAECYKLMDKGSIAPGKIADITIFKDLEDFEAKYVFIDGKLVAKDGVYLETVKKADTSKVISSIHVKDYSKDRLKLRLDSDETITIGMIPGLILSEKKMVKVKRNTEGFFEFDENIDAVKCAVIERHKMTGKIGLGILSGYGLKKGAICLTVAHDSHNIICAGTNDEDMDFAIKRIMEMGGGIVIVEDKKVLDELPLPIAGVMSDKGPKYVADKLNSIQKIGYENGVNKGLSPVMTLCFMSLLVIPELKLTPGGLFDVTQNKFL